jgi:hypothetical protein
MSYGVALRNGIPFTLGTIAALCVNATAPWSPADMPSLGAWYDPSDLSTMFQDAAGTTPVTAAGQPVGLILDKSGNGYHASQSTSTARPLFQIDGSGNCYLAFDGVDDSLSTSAIDMTGTDKVTVFGGNSSLGTSGIQIRTEFSANSDSTPGGFSMGSPVGTIWDYFQLNGTSRVDVDIVDAAYVNPKTIVVSCEFDISGSGVLTEIFPRINGVVPPLQSGGGMTGSAGTGNFGNHPLFIGSRAGSSYFFNGNIYSLIIGGTAYDAATVLAAEIWVAEKTGVTLP